VFIFIKAGTLQDELEKNLRTAKYLQNERLLNIFYGIADGLNYIHSCNLAHRDLKPHNVLMSNDGITPVLTDFGSMTEKVIEIKSSRAAQEIQDWAAQNCSMFYKAPELFNPRNGIAINEFADVWSLGCVLYALMY
jgi:serine/threonine protein kinase